MLCGISCNSINFYVENCSFTMPHISLLHVFGEQPSFPPILLLELFWKGKIPSYYNGRNMVALIVPVYLDTQIIMNIYINTAFIQL